VSGPILPKWFAAVVVVGAVIVWLLRQWWLWLALAAATATGCFIRFFASSQ
jgi:hypothetical protein